MRPWTCAFPMIALAIAGCASQTQMVQPAGVAGAAGAFDGTYIGSRTVLHTTFGCNSYNGYTIVVKNNHFDRSFARVSLSINVADDGTFEQSGGGGSPIASIKGKITGGNLEADYGSPDCMVHLSLKRI
jgi:hypothetical protein